MTVRARAYALVLAIAAAAACKPTPPGGGVKQPVTRQQLTELAPDAEPIVEAWSKAIGGREAIERLGAWHAKGSYRRGGLDGTIEVFQAPNGSRHEIIVQGILREERVFDGTRGWLVDRNREVRELAGIELDEQQAEAFLGTWAPIATLRRGGGVLLEGGKLVLKPADGHRPDTVTFDRATHLPVSYVRRDGEKLATTTLADWRTIEGIRMPMTLRRDNGNPNDAVTIRWTSITHAELDPKLFARPADREPDMTLSASPLTLPIEVVYGGLLFVKVAINDVPMSFVLDTGAEVTVLNASRLPKLGLTAIGKFATGAGGGDVELGYVAGVTTKLGDAKTGEATTRDQIVAAIPLDALEGPLRRPLDGILGYDFISRFVVAIDYKGKTLRLYDRETYRHTGAGDAQAMTLEESTPFITAAIEVPGNGLVAGRFVLDTGCLCDVQLSAPFVDEHALLTAFPKAKQAGYSAGAGGETRTVSATIPSLRIGASVVDNPEASFSRDTHGAGADPESAGLIGSVSLGRFVLVLDYRRQEFYLDPVGPRAAASSAAAPQIRVSARTMRIKELERAVEEYREVLSAPSCWRAQKQFAAITVSSRGEVSVERSASPCLRGVIEKFALGAGPRETFELTLQLDDGLRPTPAP